MTSPEQPLATQIVFPNGSEELLVTPVDGNLYRLEETSILGEAAYHDVIEAGGSPQL